MCRSGQVKVNPDPVLAALCESHYDGWVTIQQDHTPRSAEKDATKSPPKSSEAPGSRNRQNA
jgi:sugar phosphate isomerase/epimerase